MERQNYTKLTFIVEGGRSNNFESYNEAPFIATISGAFLAALINAAFIRHMHAFNRVFLFSLSIRCIPFYF